MAIPKGADPAHLKTVLIQKKSCRFRGNIAMRAVPLFPRNLQLFWFEDEAVYPIYVFIRQHHIMRM